MRLKAVSGFKMYYRRKLKSGATLVCLRSLSGVSRRDRKRGAKAVLARFVLDERTPFPFQRGRSYTIEQSYGLSR